MSVIQNILTFVLVLGVLVFFHELGHFLFAKLFKMHVEEFAFGFGKKLVRLGFDGQTEYTIRALPLGGFVRIRGMEIEDAAERRLTEAGAAPGDDYATTNDALERQETEETDDREADGFNSRPIFQRFLVIAGGPAFSFLLGWLVLSCIGFTFGLPDISKPFVSSVVAGSPAEKAGLRVNDRFLAVDGKPVEKWDDVLNAIRSAPDKRLTLTVAPLGEGGQTGATRDVQVVPKPSKDPATGKETVMIGVSPDFQVRRVGVGESFSAGTNMVGSWFTLIGSLFKSGDIKENVGGPITIFKETQRATKQGGSRTMELLGSLSLSLGLFNLFPIPILDGGHLALMILEGIRRRKLTAQQTALVFNTGFAILVVLFVAVMFKDILRLFGRG
jgi:regulator of sigma E protease